jgi:hypothetical protein
MSTLDTQGTVGLDFRSVDRFHGATVWAAISGCRGRNDDRRTLKPPVPAPVRTGWAGPHLSPTFVAKRRRGLGLQGLRPFDKLRAGRGQG